MGSGNIGDYFAQEINNSVDIYAGGRTTVEYDDMSSQEEAAIRKAFDSKMRLMKKISPSLVETLQPQREAFVKWGAIAKATIPNDQPIRYPAEPGSLGVDWLNPPFYMTNAAEATSGNYCGYYDSATGTTIGRTWDIALVGGTPNYLAGTAGNYYKGSIVDNKRTFVVIAQDGIVEMGTMPSLTQVLFQTEAASKYAPITVHPLAHESIEPQKQIYQYGTLGMLGMPHNQGTKIKVEPARTGTSTIALMGMVFYEYGLTGSDILT